MSGRLELIGALTLINWESSGEAFECVFIARLGSNPYFTWFGNAMQIFDPLPCT